MSYSFNNICHNCKEEKECTDRHFVYGAICGIHATSSERTHKGSGCIELVCNRFIAKEIE